MLKNLLLFFTVCLILQSSVIYASDERQDIKACMEKVKEFAGVSVDPFDAKYESHWTSPDIVRWRNVYCETSFDRVQILQVSGTTHIIKSYAGKSALSLYEKLEIKTESEIERLKNRLSKASEALRHKNPDLLEIEKFIDNGILSTSKCGSKGSVK